MVWFLIAVLTVVAILALFAVLVLAAYIGDDTDAEQDRVEVEVRKAQRRLHDLASRSFESMLDEARSHDHRRV